jgi:hypothetical protein
MGPRAMISAFMAGAPLRRPCSATTKRWYSPAGTGAQVLFAYGEQVKHLKS